MSEIIVFICGFALCYVCFVVPSLLRKGSPPRESEQTVLVQRNRPSMRNPMRTYTTNYDEFKTSKGLYQPVKPKPSKSDDLEASER